MKVIPTYDAAASRLTLELTASRYDDATPFVGTVFFEGLQLRPAAPAITLASAILLSKHCGSVLEMEVSDGLGLDILDAVRVIQGEPIVVSPLDPGNRELSTRRIDVNVRGSNPKSWDSARHFAAGDTTVLTADLLWTGDFVDTMTRSSASQLLGPVITNAALVAPAGDVSVAAALLLHGLTIRRIRIGDDSPIGASIPHALELVGIEVVRSPLLAKQVPSSRSSLGARRWKAPRRPEAVPTRLEPPASSRRPSTPAAAERPADAAERRTQPAPRPPQAKRRSRPSARPKQSA
jgi:hypothetical protein